MHFNFRKEIAMKTKITAEQALDSEKLITIIQSVPDDKRKQFEASLNGYLDGYAAGLAAADNIENLASTEKKQDA